MLNRQKVLLLMLARADRPVQRMELTKWCFLLRQELPSKGGSAFYDFVPYQYGPFSFCLYQEAEKLGKSGLLVERGPSSWEIQKDCKFELSDKVLLDEAHDLVDRYKSWKLDDLLDYVYSKYPKYTINSKRKKLARRKIAEPAVYTAGYEGKSVDSFLYGLIENGIRQLIDVRSNPVARRYGFHRSTLDRLCSRLGITYIHVPELGIASELRQDLENFNDYQALFSQYRKTTLKTEISGIENVANLMRETPSVLVCMEACPECCHRSHLAAVVSKKTGLEVRHLE